MKNYKKLHISALVIAVTLLQLIITIPTSYAQEEPVYGGTFVFSGPAEPIILCPVLAGDTYSNWMLSEIMEPLVEYDVNLDIAPELAESWTITDEGMTYTFNLRQGVKWHDGEDFTADDVVYTYKTIISETGVAVTHFEPVTEIYASDDHTVVVKLDRPVGGFLDGLVGNWLGTRIIPEHIYNTTEYDLRDNPANFDPVGTGPFKFVEWVKGSHVEMEANQDYWGEGPYIETLIYKIIPEQTVALMAFEAGEIDYTTNVPLHEIDRLAAIEGVSVHTHADPSAGILQFGCYSQNPGPIGDNRVRQALWLSIDNQKIVDEIYYGYADPGASSIGTSSPYHNPDAGEAWGERPNYELANQILDDAGYTIGTDGYRFTIEVMTRVGQTDREDICMILKEDWKNINVNLDVQLTEFTTLADKIKWGTPEPDAGRDYMAVTWGSSTGPEPNTNIFPRYYHTGARNYYSYNNSEVNELLLQGQVEPDLETRKEIYNEVQRIMMEEDLPLLPLTHGHSIHVW
jgi:peptide/nickel transport system substrate-binding protein